MAVTLAWIKSQALTLLAQDADSDVAALATGDGSGNDIESSDQLGTWAIEGGGILARTCLPLSATGTKVLAVGDRSVRLSALTPSMTISRLWAVRSARIGSVNLEHIQRAVLENHFPAWATANAATGASPLYYYEDGESAIGIYPGVGTGTPTLTVTGFGTPAAPLDDDTELAWLPDDLVNLLACYVAAQAAKKAFENDDLFGRAGIWLEQWDAGRLLLWQQIDVYTREAHFPTPPGVTVKG